MYMYGRKVSKQNRPPSSSGELSIELNSFHNRSINTDPYRSDAETIAANEQVLKALDTVAKNQDFLSGKKKNKDIARCLASVAATIPLVWVMERMPKDQTDLMSLTKAVCASLVVVSIYHFFHFFKNLLIEPSHYSRGSNETLNESIRAVEKILDALKAGQLKDSPFSVQEEAVEKITTFKITSDTYGSGALAYTKLNLEFLGSSDAQSKLKEFEELVSNGTVTSPKALAKLNATISCLKNWISKNGGASQTTSNSRTSPEPKKKDFDVVGLGLNNPKNISGAAEPKDSTLIRVVPEESEPEVEYAYASTTEPAEDKRRKG